MIYKIILLPIYDEEFESLLIIGVQLLMMQVIDFLS
jgi:hypothetical protein